MTYSTSPGTESLREADVSNSEVRIDIDKPLASEKKILQEVTHGRISDAQAWADIVIPGLLVVPTWLSATTLSIIDLVFGSPMSPVSKGFAYGLSSYLTLLISSQAVSGSRRSPEEDSFEKNTVSPPEFRSLPTHIRRCPCPGETSGQGLFRVVWVLLPR